ncbi:NeuD/PglB/VioB family sugar acetyltransferase [Achromobacter sp. AGC25]|jgi:sugar O-acyltransferase (sialic acid O-acetyltransferase NeuD family)
MKTKRNLVVVGAGGHGRAVAEAAELDGSWSEIVFVDDNYPGQSTSGSWKIVGHPSQLGSLTGPGDAVIVAIGNQAARERLMLAQEALGIPFATVIHPRAYVSPYATVGVGCAIMAGAIVGTAARLGRGVIVNANATVDHDAVVGDFSHLGVGVQLAGGVVVAERVWLQAGTCAGYRVRVPPDTIVGPGTSLVAD